MGTFLLQEIQWNAVEKVESLSPESFQILWILILKSLRIFGHDFTPLLLLLLDLKGLFQPQEFRDSVEFGGFFNERAANE